MKKMSLRTTVCCIACTMLAASTWAQETPSSTQRSPQGGLGSQRSSTYSHGQQQQSLRVSQQIINAQVKSQDGQQLGQIDDLIANPQTGKIEFAVISKGDKLCAIPMQLLQPQPGSSTSGISTTPTSPSQSPTTPGASTSTSRSGAQGQRVTFVAQVD